MSRVLFLYGTNYSQRENCIIGKVAMDISYRVERQYLTSLEAKQMSRDKKANAQVPSVDTNSCFLHRETYINRKIPLNALLNIQVDRVTNLKESIENIEHFTRLHHGYNEDDVDEDYQSKDAYTRRIPNTDRRKMLTHILKNGLNLVVLTSIFDEDGLLKQRFPMSSQKTRMLFNTLNPIFAETYQLPLQMDTKIFDYFKSKRAVFEVRHYMVAPGHTHKRVALDSEASSDVDGVDFLSLGHVRVPLLHLITKNSGIDGEFIIMDDFK